MVPVKQKHGLLKQILVAVLIAAVSLSSIAQTGRVNLPELGNSASNVLSNAEEREYAESLIRQMRAYELLIEDPLINDFFSDMGFNLASRSDQPEAAFNFVVLDQDVVNAFAAPGGVIALHSGLILLADTQDEVAGVLSHEIAHITQLHMYRAFEKGKTMNIIAMLAMMGLILASGGDGQVITGAVMGAQAASAQAQINFTRHNEVEADRVGIRTLAAAGYDPQGMADFFSKMGQTSRANGEGPPEFLRTHPVSVNRIAEAESRIQNLPPVEAAEGRQDGSTKGITTQDDVPVDGAADVVLVEVLADDHLQVEMLASAGVHTHPIARILEPGNDAGDPDAAGSDLVQQQILALERQHEGLLQEGGPDQDLLQPADLLGAESFLEDDLARPGIRIEAFAIDPELVLEPGGQIVEFMVGPVGQGEILVMLGPADQFFPDGTVELGVETTEICQQPE